MRPVSVLPAFVFGLAVLGASGVARAATFCVGSASELQAALNLAGHNNQEDTLRLRQGDYTASTPASAEADFHLAAMDGELLTLSGGWTAGCSQRQMTAGSTRLLPSAGRRALTLVFPAGGTSNAVWLEFLEFGQAANSPSSLATCAIEVQGEPMLVLFNLRFRDIACPAGALVRLGGEPGGFLKVGNTEFSDNQTAEPLVVVDAGSALANSQWVHLTLAFNTIAGSDLLLHDRNASSGVTFENSVIWGNLLQPHQGGYRQVELGQQANAVLRFNRLQAVSTRIPHLVWGNSVGDPGFEAGLRPRPAADSPLRNGGQMSDYTDYFVFFDLQGHPRILEDHVDIGAYEFQPPLFADGFE